MFIADAFRLRDAMSAPASLLFVVGVTAFVVTDRVSPGCANCRRELPLAEVRLGDGCHRLALSDERASPSIRGARPLASMGEVRPPS
jgi:hypothetical protein